MYRAIPRHIATTCGLFLRKRIWHIDKVLFGERLCESTRTGELKEAGSMPDSAFVAAVRRPGKSSAVGLAQESKGEGLGKGDSAREARRALAIYREARNAQQNFMVSYAVLNYYEIIEIGHRGRGDVKNWFRDNFERLRKRSDCSDEFERFAKICASEQPREYIYDACRLAVAHAGKDSKSDPDDANELARLHTAADVLRLFARDFIASEFGISDVIYSDN
jgi:hypothetical protein